MCPDHVTFYRPLLVRIFSAIGVLSANWQGLSSSRS